MERKLEVIPAERFEKPPPSCSQDHHKFRGAMNELKDMVGGNVYRYVLDACEKAYYAKAREVEDRFKVPPSSDTEDALKSLGSGVQKVKELAPTITPGSRENVERMEEAVSGISRKVKDDDDSFYDEVGDMETLKPGEVVRTEPSENLTITRYHLLLYRSSLQAMVQRMIRGRTGGPVSRVPRTLVPWNTVCVQKIALTPNTPKIWQRYPSAIPVLILSCKLKTNFKYSTGGPSGEELDNIVVSQENPAGGCQAWNTSTCTFIQADDPFQDIPGFGDPLMHPQDDQLSALWENYFSTWLT
uniref:Uncharacterized protein n=1 Tax=Physcomitrium patens TaxID=3218 RepID=A0A2K1KBS3_PHYPA|nr:uncharacterized protein LOC112284401 isoform X3 [Physcomitrium patens]PNR51234.1 hypothetical protein PHYPA_010420 [Physcomitrium patens]|eukprot:XP_024379924.1 uncharacterized protein LOC112284401 isoform X3 [Physcomitrella patens]